MSRLIVAPALVSVIAESGLEAIGAAVAASRRGGADAVEVNLAQLSERDVAGLEAQLSRAGVPIYTACRRREFMAVYGHDTGRLDRLDDRRRIERQLRLLGNAAAIDMEFDTFAGQHAAQLPGIRSEARECRFSCESRERQRTVINQVHARGFEVIFSCHTGVDLGTGETIRLAEAMAESGADVIKIIHRHADPAYCAELWKTMLALRERLKPPFTLSSIGPGAALVRRMACHLGCSYTFARPAGVRNFYPDHPALEDMRKLFAWFPPALALNDKRDNPGGTTAG